MNEAILTWQWMKDELIRMNRGTGSAGFLNREGYWTNWKT